MKLEDFLNKILKPTPFTVVGKGEVDVGVQPSAKISEKGRWRPKWKIEKYDKNMRLYETEVFEGNCLLNAGITEMWNLIIGGTATAYSNANAYIGVGDGSTAAAASQAGLQGTNKSWASMDSTYPQVSNQKVTFRATFGSGEGVHAWNEFTVVNSSDDSGDNMCRKVEDHGSKSTLDTWVISVEITLS